MPAVRWLLVLTFVTLCASSEGCSSNSSNGPAIDAVMQTTAGANSTGGVLSSGGSQLISATGASGATGAVLASGGTPSDAAVGDGTGGASSDGTGGSSAPAMGNTDCTIMSSLTMSTAISTVGIVEWSTDLAGLDTASIEFGLDQNYGMVAPVDLMETNYRTLLLGMKADHEYHYRVVATAGSQTCTGPDNTLQTGSLPATLTLPSISVTTAQPDKAAKGFLLAGFGFMTKGPTFIIDSDGDYVWWFDSGDMTRARMSYDGKSMWTQAMNWSTTGGFNGSPGGNPVIHQVSMDGMDVQTFGLNEIGDATHDYDVTPDGSYISPQFDAAGCMTIRERAANGQSHDIIASNTVNPQAVNECLVNSIHYWPSDDSITYSDLPHNCYVKITHAGAVQWVLGGANTTFTQGDAISWHGEHGHHLLSPTRFLMFNNGVNPLAVGPTDGSSSIVYEVELDTSTNTATRVWQYDGGLQTLVFGDVQRLPNGNTIVNYGTHGTTHEVDANATLVRTMTWASSPTIPYIEWRSSLYGPPDR